PPAVRLMRNRTRLRTVPRCTMLDVLRVGTSITDVSRSSQQLRESQPAWVALKTSSFATHFNAADHELLAQNSSVPTPRRGGGASSDAPDSRYRCDRSPQKPCFLSHSMHCGVQWSVSPNPCLPVSSRTYSPATPAAFSAP